MATIEILGKGPFGTVHAEWDPLLGKSVAVKELDPAFAGDETFTRAVLHRAERLFDLDHEHVLGMYRVGGREAPAVIRELAEATLAETILAGPLPPAEVETILRQALLGLQAIHERGMVHGAIKPQNLFRRGTRVKIGDFGVPGAPLVPADPVHRYKAPEQRYGGPPSPGADLYSLGLVACELLLGGSRFDQLMQGDPRRIAGLPPALSLALQRLLERAEANRAADAGEILALLDGSSPIGIGFIAPPSLDTSALDDRLRPAKPKPVVDVQKIKRAGAITFGVLLAGFAIVAVLYLRSERPEERRAPLPPAPPVKAVPAPLSSPAAPAPQSTEPLPAATEAVPAPSSQPVSLAASPSQPSPAATPAPSKPAAKSTAPPVFPRSSLQTLSQSPPVPDAVRTENPPTQGGTRPAATSPTESSSRKTPDAREIIGEILPSYYEIGSFRNGQRAYVDLDAAFTEGPQPQGRFTCIETSNSERKDGTVWFQLGREAKIFVGHDHAIGKKPGWLKEFTSTGETWSVLVRNASGVSTDLIHFDVFTRIYPAGNVSLGPNQEKSFLGKMFAKGNMYLVCVEPL